MSRAYVRKLREHLAKIESAIDEVLTAGQSMSLDDGVSYTRASLPRLDMMRKQTEAQIARATGRNPLFQSVNMSGAYGGSN
jgi:hypothetical protein